MFHIKLSLANDEHTNRMVLVCTYGNNNQPKWKRECIMMPTAQQQLPKSEWMHFDWSGIQTLSFVSVQNAKVWNAWKSNSEPCMRKKQISHFQNISFKAFANQTKPFRNTSVVCQCATAHERLTEYYSWKQIVNIESWVENLFGFEHVPSGQIHGLI